MLIYRNSTLFAKMKYATMTFLKNLRCGSVLDCVAGHQKKSGDTTCHKGYMYCMTAHEPSTKQNSVGYIGVENLHI